MNESWQEDAGQFIRNTVPILQSHGKRIGQLAREGNEDAKHLIEYYQMVYRSYDPMSAMMVEQYLEKLQVSGLLNEAVS